MQGIGPILLERIWDLGAWQGPMTMTMIIQKSAINDDILDHDGRRTTPCPYSGFPCCLSPHTGCPKKNANPSFLEHPVHTCVCWTRSCRPPWPWVSGSDDWRTLGPASAGPGQSSVRRPASRKYPLRWHIHCWNTKSTCHKMYSMSELGGKRKSSHFIKASQTTFLYQDVTFVMVSLQTKETLFLCFNFPVS